MEDLLKEVLRARVYDVALRTPLERAERLSARLGHEVLLKREDLQPCFSFKVRGAHNKIANLPAEERARGVICASAGNHAQGVALSARHLGIAATVVMPVTTPQIKVMSVRALGAEVVLAGDSYSDAYAHCQALIRETGRVFIHPFDDPLVIAGQGTIGHELLQQCPELDVVFVPIGGGGLIAGVSAFVKALRPKTRVIGVQAADSEAMRLSVAAGERVMLDNVALFADGVAVKQVGGLTFEIVRRCVDEIVTVSTDETCSAIKAIYEDTRSIVEPAGALAVAGLTQWLEANARTELKVAAVNSGANMNFDRLHFVAERTRTGERREALFAVTIPERPGALREFCEHVVGDHAVTEFNYRLAGRDAAHIFVGVAVSGDAERHALNAKLAQAGFEALDITDNELAKGHVRHMVGGKSPHATREALYSFEFPERPRALMQFLLAMRPEWNISLFHYRMHGADFGRVLVGFEIPGGDREAFHTFLDRLHYPYQDETDNPAYRMFL